MKWSENSEDITPNRDGGVRKIILKESSDKNGFVPLHKDIVKVHYTGYFEDGTCFTKSRDNQEARTFNLGLGQVLKGWEVAASTMKLHEVSIFRLSPEYAYGDAGLPPTIAPGTTVYFELELLSIEGEFVSKDGSVSRSILVHGFGTKSPTDNDLCTVSYNTQLYSDPSVIMECAENITFVLGEGFEVGVPTGVEKALKKMKKGERSRLKVRCGSGLKGHEKLGVPALSDLIHYVELIDFEETRKHWEMSREELMKNALDERDCGMQCFKAEKYQMSSRRFSRCLLYAESINFTSSELRLLSPSEPEGIAPTNQEDKTDPAETEVGLDEERKKELQVLYETKQNLILTSLLNLSLCDHKTGRNLKALDHASRALEIDPKNVKALYRKAMIFFKLKSLDDARKYFELVLEVEPNMKVARRYLDVCTSKLNNQCIRNKMVFKGMFDKFAKEDAQKEDEQGPKKDIFTDVGEWDNKMAEGMMTLEQEMAAFGETMPEKGYDKENDNPASDED